MVRAFGRFRPFEIEADDGSRERFDSLVFANITQMAKVATLADQTSTPDDGFFEVITLRHTAKWRILTMALKASTVGLGEQPGPRQSHVSAGQQACDGLVGMSGVMS